MHYDPLSYPTQAERSVFENATRRYQKEIQMRLKEILKRKYVDKPTSLDVHNPETLAACHEVECFPEYTCRRLRKYPRQFQKCLDQAVGFIQDTFRPIGLCTELDALQEQAGLEPLTCPLTWREEPERQNLYSNWRKIWKDEHPVKAEIRENPGYLSDPEWHHVSLPPWKPTQVPRQKESELVPHYQEAAFRTLERQIKSKDAWSLAKTYAFLKLYDALEKAKASENPSEELKKIHPEQVKQICQVSQGLCPNDSCQPVTKRKSFLPWKRNTETHCVLKNKELQARDSTRMLEEICRQRPSAPLCKDHKVNWLK